jgi:hypothetical protein
MNGKIQRVSLKSGVHHLQFRVVKNFRDFTKGERGMPTNKLIATVLYAPETRLRKDAFYRAAAWLQIDSELKKLHAAGVLSDAELDKITERFERRLPRPRSRARASSQAKSIDLSDFAGVLGL